MISEMDQNYPERKMDYHTRGNEYFNNQKLREAGNFPKLNLDVLEAAKRQHISTNKILLNTDPTQKIEQQRKKQQDVNLRPKYQTEGDSSIDSNNLRRHNHKILSNNSNIHEYSSSRRDSNSWNNAYNYLNTDNLEKKTVGAPSKKLNNFLSPIKLVDKGPMKFYFKTIDTGSYKSQNRLSSNSFDLGSNPKKVQKIDSSTPSKRSHSQIKSSKNSAAGSAALYSYDSKPNLRLQAQKTQEKSANSTETKRKAASQKKERHINAPQKTRSPGNNILNNYVDLSTSSIVESAAERLKKSTTKEKSFYNKSTVRPPQSYSQGHVSLEDKEFNRMAIEFQDCCDILQERGRANANLAVQLKERFSLILARLVKGPSDDQFKPNEIQKEEIYTLKSQNKEMQLKIQNLEKENQKLWGFISKIKLVGSYEEPTLKKEKEERERDTTKSKGGLSKCASHESPPIDLDRLMDLFEKQHQFVKILKRKEAKYIKLLFAIKKQGINIEEIYQNNVKNGLYSSKASLNKSGTAKKVIKGKDNNFIAENSYEQDMRQTQYKFMEQIENYNINPHNDSQILYESYSNSNSHELRDQNDDNGNLSVIHHNFVDSDQIIRSGPQESENNYVHPQEAVSSDQNYEEEGNDSDFVLYSYRDMQNFENMGKQDLTSSSLLYSKTGNIGNQKKSELNDKFKLNIGAVHKQQQHRQQQMSNANPNDPIGFHQEFMSQVNDFSLSWRQAAMKERKIP